MHDVAGIVGCVDELWKHAMLERVVAHRPDAGVERGSTECERRVDRAADGDDGRQDALAVDLVDGAPERRNEPQEEEDSSPDQNPADVDPIPVSTVGVPLDDLCGRCVPAGRAAEQDDRPDDEQDDVQDAPERRPACCIPGSACRNRSFHVTPPCGAGPMPDRWHSILVARPDSSAPPHSCPREPSDALEASCA